MLSDIHRSDTRPKSRDSIDNAIANDRFDLDVARFHYRKMFKLSALEMEQEPMDRFFTNLYISSEIQKKMEREQRLNRG